MLIGQAVVNLIYLINGQIANSKCRFIRIKHSDKTNPTKINSLNQNDVCLRTIKCIKNKLIMLTTTLIER